MGIHLVIIGAGLAGLTAAISAGQMSIQKGIELFITIVEKNERPGGNSMRASSGISALTPSSGDSKEGYERDTLTSGGGLSNPALVTTLVEQSEGAIKFLEGLGVDLSKVSRLGGHSCSRTHSNPQGPNVGFVVTRAALTAVEPLPNTRILTSTKADRIVMEEGKVVGLQVTSSSTGTSVLPADAIILATGGYAANKTMLQEVCPKAAGCATTNGPWATGDGISLAKEIGAGAVQLDQVQVHPTGFVDPADPDSPSKILAAERLRGCGGILLSMSGQRFVDELQRRDIVTAAINRLPENKAYLVLSPAAVEEFGGGAVGFYRSKGLINQVDDVNDAASFMKVDAATLRQELEKYNAACDAGSDGFGKSVFPSKIPLESHFFVGVITPVVHYTMGGVAIDESGQVLAAKGGEVVPGLFAAGEVAGGLHGANRLGGNSLLECVVFGQITAESAVKYAEQHQKVTVA